MAAMASTPSGIVPGVSTPKTRKKTGSSRLGFEAENGLSAENDPLSPSRRKRRTAGTTTPVASVNASQSLQLDDIPAIEKSTVQVKIFSGDRVQVQQGRGVERLNSTSQLQIAPSSAWMKRAQNLRERLPSPLTPTSAIINLFGGNGSSLRTLVRHPFVPWFFSLALAVLIAALFLGGLQRGAPKGLMDKVLAHQMDDMRMSMKSSESKMDNIVRHLQAQLDALDGSLKQQEGHLKDTIGEIAKDLNTRFDGVASQVKLLESQVAELLGGPQSSLTEEDLQLLARRLSEARGTEGGQDTAPLTFTELRSTSREIVLEELERLMSGRGALGPDFALSSAGGKVVAHSSAVWFPQTPLKYVFDTFKWRLGKNLHPNAKHVIDPRDSVPGECFPLVGSNGTIDIQLRGLMNPTAFSLEHIPKHIAFEVGSAPRNFDIHGWTKDKANPVLLGQYEYTNEGPSIQTFPVQGAGLQAAIDVVRLHVKANHGHPNFTCIYRLRVYGNPVRVEEDSMQEAVSVA